MLKNEKGITLIALIITIIVMLILAGVTIDVALNGGLFTKASEASEQMQIATEKEALSMSAIAAWDVENGVNWEKMQLPDGFTGSEGTYTSTKSKKIYKVDKATAKVVEGGTEEVDDDLAYLKSELEGKMFGDVISGVDANSNPIFTNTELKFVTYVRDFDNNIIAGIGMYEGKYYEAICDDFNLQNPKIIKVEKATYGAYTDNYFIIRIEGTKVKIKGLGQKGEEDIARNKKLVIPAKIVCENGFTYDVTEIDKYAFMSDENIEELEFESGMNLLKIGEMAFNCCTNLSGNVEIPNGVITISKEAFRGCNSINSIYIPSTIDNMGFAAFDAWTTDQTINMGKTEEPALVEEEGYSQIGWDYRWEAGCDANVVWGQ